MDIEVGQSQKDDNILYDANESYSYEDHSTKSLLNSSNLRIQFARKVYTILLAQLSFTALMSYFSISNQEFMSYQLSSPATITFAFIISITVMIAMICVPSLSRTVPTNFILLSIFTLCESYIVSFICGLFSWTEGGQPYYEGREIVYMAALLTLGVTFALTAYAYTTKKDFTMMGGFLFIIVSVLIMCSIMLFFFTNYLLEMVVCSLSTIVYGIYIIYDTQLIMGGKRNELKIDDYIIGALMLYVDIIRLFLRLLEILAKLKKK